MTRYMPLERLLAAYAHQPIDIVSRRDRIETGIETIIEALERGEEFDPATAMISVDLADALREQLLREGMEPKRVNWLLNLLSEAWWWGVREDIAPPLQLFARVPRQGCQRMKATRRDLAEPVGVAVVAQPVVNRRPKRTIAPMPTFEPTRTLPPEEPPKGIKGWLGKLFNRKGGSR